MTLPFSAVQNLFSAAALTATATLDNNANYSGIVQFQVVNAGFTGTLDIQGSMHAGGTFVNLPYVIVGAGLVVPAVAQLSYTTDTADYHIICVAPMPYMKVVMTRSAGSVSMWARAYSEPFNLASSSAAAAAMGDVMANPTTASYGALMMAFNGTTWDRVRTLSTGNLRTTPVPVSSANAALTNATSTAQEASRIAKATAGTLYAFTVYNNNAGAQFIQLHDSATLPADAVVPVLSFEIATQASKHIDFGAYGRRFANGIVICNSTTDVTKTIGAADCLFDVQYI